MGKLCMVLPPFSPDYSGVCSSMFGFGFRGITVIHDAAGCTGNYTGYDEPRWYHSRSPVYCSGLREIDAILGDDEKFIDKILLASEEIKPEIIALVGSPVPMVIGTDMEGIAADIENRTGIPTFGFSTTGMEYYTDGIQQVHQKVVWKILEERKEKPKKENRRVNILGATPLDFGKGEAIEDMCCLLEKQGCEVNVALWRDSSIAQVESLLESACNIVVSGSGLWLAEQMKEKYKIPYMVGIPFGTGYQKIWLANLERLLEEGEVEEENAFSEKTAEMLIIGEQVQSDSLRKAFWETYGIKADVGAVCGFHGEIAEKEDLFLETEADIEEALNCEKYKIIVGDFVYQGLLQEEKEFIPYAHYALSSKVGVEWEYSLIGDKFEKHMKIK